MDLLTAHPSAYQFSVEELERPFITTDQVAGIVREEWGMQVVSVTELGSYEDRNFLIVGGYSSNNKFDAKYLLKVHNKLFSSTPGFLETPQLLRSLGLHVAAVDMALADFSHPDVRLTHDWAITHVTDALEQFGHHLDKYEDSCRRRAADQIKELFELQVLPAAAAGKLRQQHIHHDANENNVIVDEDKQQVVALIDWSDVVQTWLVAEPAVAAAYVLLMTLTQATAAGTSVEQAGEEGLQAMGHLLGGYDQRLPLTDVEWELLPVLVAGRLLHSTAIGLETVSREPGNADHVMPDEAERWWCINLLLSCSHMEMAGKLRAAAAASNAAAGSQGLVRCMPSTSKLLPVKFAPFKLELYLARYEHLPLQLSRSSCQPVQLQYLLSLADTELSQQWQHLALGYPPNIGSLKLRQEVARTLGARVKLWSMEINPHTGQSYFSVAALQKLMSQEVKCLVVNVPHNPSGWLPTQQEWQDIVHAAAQVDVWLFSDEIYRLLEPQPQQQRLPAAVCCYPGSKGISLGGVSKAFGLQGLRSGWLVCRDVQLLEQAERIKSFITTTGAITSELLTIVALRHQDTLVGRCRGIIRENTAAAADFFSRVLHDIVTIVFIFDLYLLPMFGS
eukprot:gene4684-4937_t